MQNVANKRMAISQLAECARELRELRTFTAVDYAEIEEQYGRADGKPIDGGIVRPAPADKIGKKCEGCPVPRVYGECAVRDGLQQLAAEHRAKFELAEGDGKGSLIDRAECFAGDQAVDFRFEEGWQQRG